MNVSRHPTFRRRLALQTMLVSGVVLAAFGIASWWYARQQLARNLDFRITESANRLAPRLNQRSQPDLIRKAVQDLFGDLNRANSATALAIAENDENAATLFVAREVSASEVTDFKAHLPAFTRPALQSRESPPATTRGHTPPPSEPGADRNVRRAAPTPETREPIFFNTEIGGEAWRVGGFGYPRITVFVGLSLREYYAEARRTGWWFTVAAITGLGLAGLGAWWSSRRAMQPLERIVATAQALTAADLSQRIAIESRDHHEFVQLITVLNDMTSRLQQSFLQAARFTADASHELKTPLAVVQAMLHDALRQSAPGIAHERLECVAREIARLKSITQSLLTLSQADAGKLPLQWEDYDLSADLQWLVEDAEVLCANAGLRQESKITSGLHIRADRTLMRQVFQNLLTNAVKYNRPAGLVRIELAERGGCAEFTITNTGSGIHAGSQARIFERFYRGDAARDRGNDGFGLGLNIAFELASANGADLCLIEAHEDAITFLVSIACAVHV